MYFSVLSTTTKSSFPIYNQYKVIVILLKQMNEISDPIFFILKF